MSNLIVHGENNSRDLTVAHQTSTALEERVIDIKVDWISRDEKGSFISVDKQTKSDVVNGIYSEIKSPGDIPPINPTSSTSVAKKDDGPKPDIEPLFDDRRWVQFLYNKDPEEELRKMEELKNGGKNSTVPGPINSNTKNQVSVKSKGLGFADMFSNVSRGMFNLFPGMKTNPYASITSNNIAKKAHNQCVFSTQALEKSLNTLSSSKDPKERAAAVHRVKNSLDSIQSNLNQLKDVKKSQLNPELKHQMKHFQKQLSSKNSPLLRANKVLKNSLPDSALKQLKTMVGELVRSIKKMLKSMLGMRSAPSMS